MGQNVSDVDEFTKERTHLLVYTIHKVLWVIRRGERTRLERLNNVVARISVIECIPGGRERHPVHVAHVGNLRKASASR